MMCVLIIMTLIPVRTDSCMRLPFWRQMFSCLVIWVDSNWGKRTVWTQCCSLLFHTLFFFFFFHSLPPLFPSLGCLLGRSLTRSHQLLQGSPWPFQFILLHRLSEHRRKAQGRALNSSQLSSTQSSLMMLSILTCDTSCRLGLTLMLTGSA